MALLEISDLRKSYPLAGGGRQEVLKGINLSLEAGEFVAVIGESGSGKSTLLNIVGGMDSDYQGQVRFRGRSLREYRNNAIDDYRKLNIGFIFQTFNLIPTLTVLENIKTPSQMTNLDSREREEKARRLVNQLGLSGMEQKLPAQLSGGQKQRVAIARALMNDPDILLADEPTGALDKENAQSVTELLGEIARKGTLVIVVTHSQRVAAQCQKVVAMEYGLIAQVSRNTEEPTPREENAGEKKLLPRKTSMAAALKTAYKNIRKNKSRNLLVCLGSAIGIFAVVIMLFLSQGMEAYITQQMYASNSPLIVEAYKPDDSAPQMSAPQTLISTGEPFTQEEIQKISRLDQVADWEAGTTIPQSCTYTVEDKEEKIILLSTTYQGYNPALKYGTMPQKGEVLISQSLAQSLGENMEAVIGTELSLTIPYDAKAGQVAQATLTISGIKESETVIDGKITSVYLTGETLKDLFSSFGAPSVTSLYLTAHSQDEVEELKAAVQALGYSVNRQDAALGQISTMLDLVTIGLTGIAAISLLVSGIMIMVVLFISVVERTKEIGTLRAMGAGKGDIRKNFVSEGFLLGIFGGCLGVLLAILLGNGANRILLHTMNAQLVQISPQYALFGLVVSMAVSTLAALIPAAKAASLDPVEALRYE